MATFSLAAVRSLFSVMDAMIITKTNNKNKSTHVLIMG
jgi:hypothetical protein